MVKFDESTIPETFSVLESGKGYTCPAAQIGYLANTYIAGISDFLRTVENKEHPCAIVVQDMKGNFVFGACIEYNDVAGDDLSGNWNYFYTFYENDIPENATKYLISNEPVYKIIAKRGSSLCNLVFTEPGFCTELAIDLFNVIKNYLDQNAPSGEGEKFELEQDASFEASVQIENGEKVLSILPKGEMKSLVNNHDANDAAA